MPGIAPEQVESGERSLWRYRAALPPLAGEPISMGEGRTPLVPRAVGGAEALLKCEWFMPTGSFKDRGASVMLSLLREFEAEPGRCYLLRLLGDRNPGALFVNGVALERFSRHRGGGRSGGTGCRSGPPARARGAAR